MPPIFTRDPHFHALALTPLVEGRPWTAPAFVNRQIKADPRIYCAIRGEGEDANGEYVEERCTCLTEQGSRHFVAPAICRDIAINGEAYNPFKSPSPQISAGVQGRRAPAAMDGEQPSAPSPSAVMAGDQVSGYGAMVGNGGPSAP